MSNVPEFLQANGPNNDFTSQPFDLSSMGFPVSQPSYNTPGINSTYPNSNPAPQIASTTTSDSPGFFGSLWNKVENAGEVVLADVEAAPSMALDGVKSAYGGVKSAVGTVGSDIGGGLSSMLGGVESHVFMIFGVIVVGVAVVLWSAGKSGAVKANVIL